MHIEMGGLLAVTRLRYLRGSTSELIRQGRWRLRSVIQWTGRGVLFGFRARAQVFLSRPELTAVASCTKDVNGCLKLATHFEVLIVKFQKPRREKGGRNDFRQARNIQSPNGNTHGRGSTR